ncbi:MAG: nucleotidyltransferase domain-containing protein [Candidatus Omnitrophota bacterium]
MANNFVDAISKEEIAKFCQRWKIKELALFGSVLRDDFDTDSDVDIMADFGEKAEWGLLDHVQMQNELQAMFHRKVDFIGKRAIERSKNWLRRQAILDSAQILFSEYEAEHAER